MKSILIVDDQESIRELVRVSLEFDDYEIHEADSGASAWQMLQQLKPDLVLTDLMMPGGVDGLELCRRIRSDRVLGATKIIMLSAKDGKTDRSAGILAGVNGYLGKPFSPMELMKTIAFHLS